MYVCGTMHSHVRMHTDACKVTLHPIMLYDSQWQVEGERWQS